ncbi:MAG: hypothetical protein ACE5G5_14125 [Candidatus Methylomirabilales bacterium]
MTARPGGMARVAPGLPTSEISMVYQEGIIAGVIGAGTVALWVLVVDTLAGRPLYTPTVLGTALFQGTAGLGTPGPPPVSWEMVMMYTWVHGLVFCVIGGLAARLLAMAEKDPNLGFGILLLFVVFEYGFIAAAMLFAEPILHTLAWEAILIGNLLAAAAMGGYFRHRHPYLTIRP